MNAYAVSTLKQILILQKLTKKVILPHVLSKYGNSSSATSNFPVK
jgi:hypothetical protein